jgi:CheY-like chemotaxis protein
MPPDVQEKVFQPFFSTKADGMGLGLSLVYGTIKRHSGQIKIKSRPKKGTAVTLLFPIDLSAGEVREPAQPYVTRKATVLIVEDNPEVTGTLCQMLEGASHKVTAVTDGEEGIEKYRESKFDIVITDIGMPGLSGWEVSKAIKAHDPDARIIFITAWGVQLEPERIKESGASLVIQKPFEKSKILSAIENLLGGARPAARHTPQERQ